MSTSLAAKEPTVELLDRTGIVDRQPTDDRLVESSHGYLIAYTAKIPGTDITFEMVPIPGGTFLLGSPTDEASRQSDEGPQVRVNVPPMWMGKCEVTWAEYKQYMRLCSVFEKFDDLQLRQISGENEIDAITAPSKLYDPSFTFSAGDGPTHPAVSMSQYAAKQYTKWLSLLTGSFYRLPTEAEWEYACRAGSPTAYSFGNDPSQLSDYAWHYENADDTTHPVGEKQPNAWGLYDMHGNASEWVLDSYNASHYEALSKLSQPLPARDAICRQAKLFPRVLRGGSWNLDPPDCRSAARRPSDDDNWRSYDPNSPQSPWWFASDQSQDVGFRIVRPLEPVPREQREKYWQADVPSIMRVANQRIDNEGRGERGLVDPALPAAIEKLPTK